MGEIIATLVAFVVILLVLYRYVFPLVTTMVKDRQAAIQQQVDDSAEAERLLAEAHQRHDSAVSDARAEAARLRDDARLDATRIKEELVEQAEAEVVRMKQRGQEQLVAERDQAVRTLRGEVGGQSMDLAERLVVESLGDERSRSASVDGFLAQLGKVTQRGSGSTATPAGKGA